MRYVSAVQTVMGLCGITKSMHMSVPVSYEIRCAPDYISYFLNILSLSRLRCAQAPISCPSKETKGDTPYSASRSRFDTKDM